MFDQLAKWYMKIVFGWLLLGLLDGRVQVTDFFQQAHPKVEKHTARDAVNCERKAEQPLEIVIHLL